MTDTASDELALLRQEVRDLRVQLDAKTRIATRAMATYQQRALQMEEHAADLRSMNDEVRRVNERLSATLRSLEERDRLITSDLEQASRFQALMMPALPRSERVSFSVFYRPAELVGGDVYDIFERSPGSYRVFLADATGHGVQAALRTMLLKAEYDRVKDRPRPDQTLTDFNKSVTAKYPGLEMQCSASCLDIDVREPGKARVRYATAAHPPLLVFDGAQTRTVYQSGPFIGVVPDIELESIELEVDPGQRLLIYTDGLEEQWNSAGDEFGIEQIQATIGDTAHDLSTAVQKLIGQWTEFVGESRPDDDATLIAIECVG